MYIVFLRFSDNRAQVGEFMDAHNAWLGNGFDDGVFLLAGSLQPGQGGAVVAHGCSIEELQSRVDADPFVANRVVESEILEISPARAEQRLSFLLPQD